MPRMYSASGDVTVESRPKKLVKEEESILNMPLPLVTWQKREAEVKVNK